MSTQAELKARLLKLKGRMESYGNYRTAAGYYNGWNPLHNGTRWVESLAGAGLRFVGWSDELAGLERKGWYTSEFCDEVYRGCVLQLPARHGAPVYLAAYADPINDGSHRVEVSQLFEGEDSKRDAAYAADSFAEREAENEREYQEAFQRGSQWADCGESIKSARAEIRKLSAEIRDGSFGPAICATLRGHIRSLRHAMNKAAETRRELVNVNSWWASKYREAFNAAAGAAVL